MIQFPQGLNFQSLFMALKLQLKFSRRTQQLPIHQILFPIEMLMDILVLGALITLGLQLQEHI